ncbi:MAG TPA: PQQ-binding-like beta-propeller repeat protein [Pseudonocardiaceae bacterium]
MKTGGLRTASRLTITALAVAGLTLVGGAGGAVPAQSAQPSIRVASGWTAPNGDKNNTRHVLGPINSHNVNRLSVAWTVPIQQATTDWPGNDAATPVVVDGVAYTQDLNSNVYAIDLHSGKLLWTKLYTDHSAGPNGVNVADGKVFGATESSVFALDARTGTQLWSKTITQTSGEGVDMAPGVNDGTVYVSTVAGNNVSFDEGNGKGVLWALDEATGRTKWTWQQVPTALWGNTTLNSGGGMWGPPSFDANGDLYVSVGNPGPFIGTSLYPWGASRPGPNLYTNSIVKLSAKTGRMLWYNQVEPHDVFDWDLNITPVLTTVDHRPVALVAGKMGDVFEFDSVTGHLLWKTPVGVHNGHDQDNLFAMRGQTSKLPQFPFTVFPGVLGGVMSQLAIDGTTAYAAVSDSGVTWLNQTDLQLPSLDSGTGELVALDLETGRIKWSLPLPSSAYGAASVVNDLVFTTTFDGTVYAVNTRTGKVAWQAKLPAHANSPVAINGRYVLAAGGWPMASNETAQIVAYRLGD